MKTGKLLAGLLSGLMMLTFVGVMPENVGTPEMITAKADASEHTADDAVEWVKSKVDQTVGNGQCVGLINGYMSYLGVDYTQYLVVGAKDFSQPRFCPTGWSQIAGATPQKGDVLVYTDGEWGHVAVFESDSMTWHQNFDGKQYVVQVPSSYWYWNRAGYWGVLRPNFKDAAPPWYDKYDRANLGSEFYAYIENPTSHLRLSYDVFNALAAEPDNSDKQIWRFVRQSDGGYSILNKDNGMSLDISNYGKENGTNVQLMDFVGNTAQHFYLYQTIGGFLIRPACSDLVFDMEGYPTLATENYNIATYPLDDYYTNKTFSIIKQYEDYPLANLGDDFDARIENPVSKLRMTVDGDNVIVMPKTEDDTQIWHFTRNADGSYSIFSKVDDRCIDVSKYGTENGTNLQVIGYSGNNAQRFFLYEADGAYLFRPACSDLVFDMEGYPALATESYNLATYPLDDYSDNKLFAVLMGTEETTEEKIPDTPPVTEPPVSDRLYGDTTDDGAVDILDVITLNKYLLGSGTMTSTGKKNADVNGDTFLDTTDSLNILKLVVEILKPEDFPLH